MGSTVKSCVVGALDILGNPSSIHGGGRGAQALIEKARDEIAKSFGVKNENVVFTGGATEANALALSAVTVSGWFSNRASIHP